MTLPIQDEQGRPTGRTIRLGDPRQQSLAAIRAKAVQMLAARKAGHDPRINASPGGLTLQNAFDLHLKSMIRRGRSMETIEDYRYKLDRYLSEWKNALLSKITRPKGGTKRAFTMPLSDDLIGLLSARKADNAKRFPDSPYVFLAESKSRHIEEPRPTRFVVVGGKHWKVRDAALPLPHALRYTFAAVCENRLCYPAPSHEAVA